MDVKKLGIETTQDKKYASWIRACYRYARKSSHPTTHVGALLVKDNKIILKGMNTFAPGVKHTKKRTTGESVHHYLNHAERDLIYKAAKKGLSIKGLTMAMPCLPCINCVNAIITSGIKFLVTHKQMIEKTDDRWREEIEDAVNMLKESKVKIIAYDGKLNVKAYFNYNEWEA